MALSLPAVSDRQHRHVVIHRAGQRTRHAPPVHRDAGQALAESRAGRRQIPNRHVHHAQALFDHIRV